MINAIRCPDIDELDGLLEDALAPDRRVEVEDHLEHCATCQKKVATLDVDPVVANYLKAPNAVVDPMLQSMMEKAKQSGAIGEIDGRNRAKFTQRNAELSALGQEFAIVSQAMNQVIKTVGEAQATIARKG